MAYRWRRGAAIRRAAIRGAAKRSQRRLAVEIWEERLAPEPRALILATYRQLFQTQALHELLAAKGFPRD